MIVKAVHDRPLAGGLTRQVHVDDLTALRRDGDGEAERTGEDRGPRAAGDDDAPGEMRVGARGDAGDATALDKDTVDAGADTATFRRAAAFSRAWLSSRPSTRAAARSSIARSGRASGGNTSRASSGAISLTSPAVGRPCRARRSSSRATRARKGASSSSFTATRRSPQTA